MEKVIVLVGSTGNGKSTLGSFLHDPIEYEKNPVFLRAKSVHPQTSKIQAETKDGFTIVDTPGLNENCKGDLEHTVEILDYFKSLQNVSAIVFCFNLANNRIDTEFYKTVEFYSELFRICMKQNVLIVLTGVCLDEVSAWKRNNDNLDIQEICTSLALEISKFVGLDYVPTAISIDAYPSTTSQEEYQEALKSRNLILNTISEMPVINIQKTLFCKTQQMKWMDTLEIAKEKGEKEGYESVLRNFDLSEENKQRASVLIKEKDDKIKKLERLEKLRTYITPEEALKYFINM